MDETRDEISDESSDEERDEDMPPHIVVDTTEYEIKGMEDSRYIDGTTKDSVVPSRNQ